MPPITRRTRAFWAASQVFALPELWALVAKHSWVVGAWRLTGVCRVARMGAKEWLRTLPGLVVCGGHIAGGEITSEVWRLNLGELLWERMPNLARGRYLHACCAVRGRVVVLGGQVGGDDESDTEEEDEVTASVDILGYDSCKKQVLPPLSCGPIYGAATVAIQESESELGQVLLIGGRGEDNAISLVVHKVDLATGVCTPQLSLLSHLGRLVGRTAARLADGRVVCVGVNDDGVSLNGTAQILEPPEQDSPTEASWQWRYLPPATSLVRGGGRG
jgi:hypothetical protein